MQSAGNNERQTICRSRLTAIGVAISFVVALFFGINPGQAVAAQVVLAWDANREPDVSGYKLYSGTASRTYGTPINVGKVTTYTVIGLADGRKYFFALTAYDKFGNESGYSNEVSYATPSAPTPEIDILGNAVSIVNDDTTPAAADLTDFGGSNIDGGTVTRTFTIRNKGAGALTLSGSPRVKVSGANTADFTVLTQPVSPVASGGSTTFRVRFNPSAPGMRSAKLTIANNDSEKTPYNFAIQGAGIRPEINLSGNLLSIADGDTSPAAADFTDFGSMSFGGGTVTRTFTIWNMGSGDLTLSGAPLVAVHGVNAADFTVTAQPVSPVAANESTTFQVRFDPRAAGKRVATLVIANNDANENPYNFAIRGTGTAPEISLVGNSLNIADGDTSPTAADHTNFGGTDILAGTVTRTFKIRNTGTEVLTLSGSPPVVVTGLNAADFRVTVQPPSSVAPGASATFQVNFDPGALGTRAAMLGIANNDPNENPFDFAIGGTGVNAPEIYLRVDAGSGADGGTMPAAESNADFGSTDLATGAVTRTFTIRNLGTKALSLSGSPRVRVGGAHAPDFKVTVQPPPSIAAAESATFQVRFDPSAAGRRIARLSIANNDANENPCTFGLMGIGVTPEINLSGNAVSIIDGNTSPRAADHTDFGDTPVAAGTETRTFTIWNNGSGALNLSGSPRVAIGGSNAADFTVTTQPETPVAPAGRTTFQVRFAPSAAGTRIATLAIANNDTNENPYNFAIRGTGTATAADAAIPATAATASSAETLSKPAAPSGPTSLAAGVTYTFATHGAISSSGDAVQYRFSWSDGTASAWLPVGVVSATKSWAATGTYTQVQVQARCASHPAVVSAVSAPLTVTVGAAAVTETLMRPMKAVGATSLPALATSVYRTGGAVSSSGDALQYRFLWSDGTMSAWLPVGVLEASKSWSSPGSYEVRAEARCALHPSVVSAAATPLLVNITPGIDEDLSQPALPIGPGGGRTGFLYAFDAGGAFSSVGDPVHYRFAWGDGTTSDWIAADESNQVRAWKFWSAEGIYSVSVEAQCPVHPGLTIPSETVEVRIVHGDPQMFFDTFAGGAAGGDTRWQVISGGWVMNPDETFATDARHPVNLAIVGAIPEFTAGRLTTRVKLGSGSTGYNVGVIFSYTDAEHYRYLALSGSKLYLGQVGDTAAERGGVKASATRPAELESWHQLRVDVHPDGEVNAYFGQSELPDLTFRFGDAVGGQVGCAANTSAVSFDDFGIWDERVLLP